MSDNPLDHVVGALVSEAVAGEGELLTRWVMVAEALDGESGERQLRFMNNDDMQPWEITGLLQFALQFQQAMTARLFTEDD